MNVEVKKMLEEFENKLQHQEDDLDEIHWMLRRGLYEKAGKLIDTFEKSYDRILLSEGFEDMQYRFLQLKLEVITREFSYMELGKQEEQMIAELYRVLIRMNRLPIRAVRYLFQRESYLRLQKKLDFLDAKKALNKTWIIGGLSLSGIAVAMYGTNFLFGNLSTLTITCMLLICTLLFAVMIIWEMLICKQAYVQWQNFLMNPVPFEQTELF